MKPKHVKSPKISVGCTVNFLKIICMMLKFVSSLQKEIVPKWEQKSKNKEWCAEIGTIFDF